MTKDQGNEGKDLLNLDGAPGEKPSELAPKAQGGPFDNIPPLTSKHPSELSSGGEDTARISVWATFDPNRFQPMAQELDRLKAQGQDTGEGGYIVLGDTPWEVNNSGFHLGPKGKRGPYYRWQLRHGGVRFGLANRWTAHRPMNQANIWLEIGSEVLMVSGGLKPVYENFQENLASAGAKVNGETLSEVHVCVDLPNVDVGEFVERYRQQKFVCRGKYQRNHEFPVIDGCTGSTHAYGLYSTGFEFGTGIQICVYEKRLEVEHSITKKAILEALRWGGPVEKAVRIEFKVRRDILKSRGITTLADWEEKKAGFVTWLTEDWFRMTEDFVDRTNTSRERTWKTWQIVQALFADWAGKGAVPPQLGLGIHLDPKLLIRQAVGCITQAMALRGMGATNMSEFLDSATRLLRGYSSIEDVLSKLEKKVRVLTARSPRRAFFSC